MSLARNLARLFPNASGLLPNANIEAMAAAKLTGQVPDANAPSGSVIQVVSGYNSGKITTNATSFTSLRTSPSITPISTNSKIVVLMQTSIFRDGANGNAYFAVYRNGSTSLIGSGSVENAGWWNDYSSYTFGQWTFAYVDSPSTTSAINYQVMAKADGPTVNAGISGRGQDSDHQNGVNWVLMEISP